MHNVQIIPRAHNKQTCQPKLPQKNGQSKQGTKVTNKQAFKINKQKLPFKFGLKKFEKGGGKLNWKVCSFSHTCKNMKGGNINLKQEEQR
jgi:hypothetical protein